MTVRHLYTREADESSLFCPTGNLPASDCWKCSSRASESQHRPEEPPSNTDAHLGAAVSEWFVAYNLNGGDPADPSYFDDGKLDPEEAEARAEELREEDDRDDRLRRQRELRRNGLL